jgi:hypothetical protein
MAMGLGEKLRKSAPSATSKKYRLSSCGVLGARELLRKWGDFLSTNYGSGFQADTPSYDDVMTHVTYLSLFFH